MSALSESAIELVMGIFGFIIGTVALVPGVNVRLFDKWIFASDLWPRYRSESLEVALLRERIVRIGVPIGFSIVGGLMILAGIEGLV